MPTAKIFAYDLAASLVRDCALDLLDEVIWATTNPAG